jgi:hypothetical protein
MSWPLPSRPKSPLPINGHRIISIHNFFLKGIDAHDSFPVFATPSDVMDPSTFFACNSDSAGI